MTKEFNFRDFIAHKDFYELEDMRSIIQQEINFRKDESYKEHVNNILIAIQDLIDNGFGDRLATLSCYTWKELLTLFQEYN